MALIYRVSGVCDRTHLSQLLTPPSFRAFPCFSVVNNPG